MHDARYQGDPRNPNPAKVKRMPAMHALSSGARMATPQHNLNLAAPVQQLTPNQMFFIDTNAAGRWAMDPGARPIQAHGIRRRPDGTADTIRLGMHGKAWIDLGGKGARDHAAGRPC